MITEGNTYYLDSNVVGPYSGKLYACKGDQVMLIAIHNNMVIVERNGIAFPAGLDCLSESEQQQDTGAESLTVNHPKRRTIKKLKSKSSSLF